MIRLRLSVLVATACLICAEFAAAAPPSSVRLDHSAPEAVIDLEGRSSNRTYVFTLSDPRNPNAVGYDVVVETLTDEDWLEAARLTPFPVDSGGRFLVEVNSPSHQVRVRLEPIHESADASEVSVCVSISPSD